MVFNFSLTQKLSPFFSFLPEGELCFWNFSFLTESARSSYFGRVQKQSVFRAITVSTNYLLIDIQPEKRKPTVLFFFCNKGDIPL